MTTYSEIGWWVKGETMVENMEVKRDRALVKAETSIEALLQDTDRLIKSRKKGEKWCQEAVAPVCGLKTTLDWLDASKKASTTILRGKIIEIEKPYKEWHMRLEVLYDAIRDRIQEEHEGKTAIKEEGVGELVFRETPGYEVLDMDKVPREYLMVDHKRVIEDIKGGVTNIKGMVIEPKRILSVRPAKADADE